MGKDAINEFAALSVQPNDNSMCANLFSALHILIVVFFNTSLHQNFKAIRGSYVISCAT